VDSFVFFVAAWRAPKMEVADKTITLEIRLPCTLADVCEKLSEWSFAAVEELAFAAGIEFLKPEKIVQTSEEGPRCKQCRAFITYARVESHGLCMKCELENK
jgi:hypothetical protein